jgi:hypothetical protein
MNWENLDQVCEACDLAIAKGTEFCSWPEDPDTPGSAL